MSHAAGAPAAEPAHGTRGAKLVAWLALGVLLAIWIACLDMPFARVRGFADWIGRTNALIATNYERYGIAATRGGQVMNLEPAPAADWSIYYGHPATLDILTAGVSAATGRRSPWTQRLLPLLASAASLFLLHRLLTGEGRDPWPALALFAASPIAVAHGVNFSYEPLALAAMLGLAWLWQRGARFSLLPALFAGGLIDYPVLYVAPVFGVFALVERGSSTSRTQHLRRRVLLFSSLGVVAVLSMATSVLHNAWASRSETWAAYLARALTAEGVAPGLLELARSQALALGDAFTIPVALLALVAAVVWHRRLGPTAIMFACAGVMHVGLFRAHAVLHDFWLWYLAPFVAIAAARLVAALAIAWSAVVLLVLAGLGVAAGTRVWIERGHFPVRAIATELGAQFEERAVLHHLRGPPGWALEVYRGHPVHEGFDLLDQVVRRRSFQPYLDLIAGTWGYLGRPQLAVLYAPEAAAGDAAELDRWFPNARVPDFNRGRWQVWDIEPFLLDPQRSPVMREHLGDAQCVRLRERARMFLALPLVPPGGRLAWLSPAPPTEPERYRSRWVRIARPAELGELEATRWHVAAWPGSEEAQVLEADPRRRHAYEVTLQGARIAIPYRGP